MENVRSPQGHAAYAMSGVDDRWILIQKNTFMNWVNEQLRTVDKSVDDLQTDFCDGIKLCSLVEVLQEKRIGRVVKKPVNQHQYFENVNLALRAMMMDNIKLVNIGGEDVVKGNLKLILALVWHLILRYQIGKQSKVPPKKLMLAWINAVIPDCDIHNFNSDWNDGVALHALIEYCRPGTCPNWRQLNRREGVNNCRNAMELARNLFDIPLVLTPENLASPDLDDLSTMTYLSYFMKVNSPGYDATLKWVNSVMPGKKISNFQSDWNDGTALLALVDAVGGDAPQSQNDWTTNLQNAINAATDMGIDPIITAKEMADTDVDHLGVMAYAAWFQHVAKLTDPSQVKSKADMVAASRLMPSTNVASLTTFNLEMTEDRADKGRVKVEVTGPSSQPPARLEFRGNAGRVEFTPVEPGEHQVVVYYDGELVRGFPATVDVIGQVVSVTLAEPIPESLTLNVPTEIKIHTGDAGGNVKVEARAPSGKVVDLAVADSTGVYTANFTPTEVGDWTISITYNGQHIQGSPFNVRVYDASQVKVYGLEGGAVGKTFSFSADCGGAGEGSLTVDILHNGTKIPVNIYQEGRGLYRVSFTPDGAGVYTIKVMFAGMEVAGSPYTLEIVDSSMVTASGEGLSSVGVNKMTSFMVNTRGAGGGDIRVNVTSPSGALLPCQVFNMGDETFRVEYTPTEVGEYHIEVLFFGKPISGSPFSVQVYDSSRIHIKNLLSSVSTGRIVEFDIDASSAGSGNLEIMVNDGKIPCSVQNRGNRQFHASFTPEEPIPHFIQMRFNGRDVPGSPWRVDVRGAANIQVAQQSLSMMPANRAASFEVNTGIEGGVLTAYITAPSGRSVPNRVMGGYGGVYRVEFTPKESGNHVIDLNYDGMLVPGSPFNAKVFNSQGIQISPIPNGIVGRPVEFSIDVNQAGEGQLEIMVNRGSVPNSVRMIHKGLYQVSFVPRDTRPHTVEVKFNGDLAPGCPINVPILDASRVVVHGEGLSNVAVNRQSFFNVNTQNAGDADLSVRVTGPYGAIVPAHVSGNSATGFDVQYTPMSVGTHVVDVRYAEMPVPGSPFYAKAFDVTRIRISGMEEGAVGRMSKFIIDMNAAGEGNTEISISCGGRNIQNHVKQIGQGKFEVSYTPHEGSVHIARVLFNGIHVPGSPFDIKVMDASKVTASGNGLGLVPCHKLALFNITAPGAQAKDIDVKITARDNRTLMCRVRDAGNAKDFLAEYMPNTVGDHRIDVTFAGTPIPSSPFTARAYDAGNCAVSGINRGIVGKPVTFNIDASRAGAGNLEIAVSLGGQNIPNVVKSEGHAKFLVSFTPMAKDTYTVSVKFNGDPVSGSPFAVPVLDSSAVTATGRGLQQARANQITNFNVHANGTAEAEVDVKIKGPSGQYVPAKVTGSTMTGFHVEYTPVHVGRHQIDVSYAGLPIPHSPFYLQVFDPNKVQVEPVSKGTMGLPVSFTVDASAAGEGQLTVDVREGLNSIVTDLKQTGPARYEVTFTPTSISAHSISITFNDINVPGSPFSVMMEDPMQSLRVSSAQSSTSTEVDKDGFITISTSGSSVDQDNFKVIMKAPNGDLVPAKIIQQPDGDYKVEYSSKYTGGHMVEILYAGQPIMGSPFYVEIYDPNKLRIDGERSGMVGQPIQFEVNRIDAGKAELGVTVTSPSGRRIPYDSMPTAVGDRFTYVPQESGVHNIYITYGGLEVPGCPLRQDIADSALVSASGDGLHFGREHQPAKFYVDTRGARGDLFVQVDGPNSIAKCNIEPEGGGRYRVTYTPVEVGLYNITIKWNGREIAGSAFHPKIIDPARVHFADGWEKLVDSNNRIMLDVNERKRLVFDTRGAGPGDLTADVKGPLGSVKCDVDHQMDGRIVLSFVPNVEGDYFISVYYADTLLPKAPFLAYAGGIRLPVDHNKVVLTGHGLKEAHVKDEAEFLIDGSQAGPAISRIGKPSVQLTGVKQDIPVSVTSLGGDKYKCTYTPQVPGAYLLHIRWSEYQVRGSPFKVNVVAPGDASKVICTGDGLKQGIMGRDIQAVIDTRRAGPGELTAQCMGPSKVAYCELFDHHNGTFALKIKPQEVGRHVLQVKYGGQHVTGSPFTLKIAGAPDASKVIVRGPGIMPGILANYRSKFICETKGAGAGQLTVRIRGPKGAFRVEMQRESHKDRTILCKYDPTEVGDYMIYVKWSGEHVPGSPFKIQIFDTIEELQQFLAENPDIKMRMGVEMNEV